jgi:predicted outer membrane lipoprotein
MTNDVLGERVTTLEVQVSNVEKALERLQRSIESKAAWNVGTTLAASVAIIAAMGFLKVYTTETISSRVASVENICALHDARILDLLGRVSSLEGSRPGRRNVGIWNPEEEPQS